MPAKNIAASVRQRLLNLAKTNNKRFNDLLQHYALERWLYRLSRSEHSSRFVLKGALMLTAWKLPMSRPTRDIDLLARASNDLDSVRRIIEAVCNTPVDDDGLLFDSHSIVTTKITEDADYEGVRVNFYGKLGTARLPMQVDMGFSDIVTPKPVEIEYPTLLDMPTPKLQAYNRETAIAEKFEAMLKIGELNSRMKDFFDIWALAATGAFDGVVLSKTIRATFERRGTKMDLSEVCFTDSFARDGTKEAQWKAFIKRSELKDAPASFSAVCSAVMAFLKPVALAIDANTTFNLHWQSGRGWSPKV